MNYQKVPATDAESATFHDILPKIRGLIARSLINGAAWDRLLDRTGDLPAWWPGSYFGFEFRLGDATPAADFFVGMLLNGPLVREYVRRGEATKSSSAEASFARFLAESSRANARWTDLFSSAGLECDIAEVPRERRPAPGVFLKLRRVPQTDRGRVPGSFQKPLPGPLVGATTQGSAGCWSGRLRLCRRAAKSGTSGPCPIDRCGRSG